MRLRERSGIHMQAFAQQSALVSSTLPPHQRQDATVGRSNVSRASRWCLALEASIVSDARRQDTTSVE